MKKTSYILAILALGSFIYIPLAQAQTNSVLIFSHVTNKPHPHIKTVKEDFEKKRKEIWDMYRKGQISKKEARELLMEHKKEMIFKTRDKIKQEQKKKMDEKRLKLKSQINNALTPKFNEIEKLSIKKQKLIYSNLIAKIEKIEKQSTKRQRVLYKLMNEIIKEKFQNINKTKNK